MSAGPGIGSICCVVVTYQPDLAVLRAQMQGLPGECARVVVDNASDPAQFAAMREMLTGFGVVPVRNERNIGLAAAQNQGAAVALERFPSCAFLLFLDQDTEVEAGAVSALLDGYLEAAARHGAGAAGPRLVDVGTGLQHGFHVMRGLRWVRLYPGPEQREAIDCANLNGSGTLVPVAVWQASGGMDEALFIDHVDTDWSFRMRSLGYRLHGVPRAAFAHRMGDASRRVWLFGWRAWPLRSPQRHFFLYRNSVRLMRRSYVPLLWKAWAVAKLGLTLVITLFVDERPLEQLRQMAKGLRAGFAA